jgi:hypothetical protein
MHRVLESADRRKTWARVLRNGAPAFSNEHAWRAALAQLKVQLPRDI